MSFFSCHVVIQIRPILYWALSSRVWSELLLFISHFFPLSDSPFLLLSGGVGSLCRGGEADGGAPEWGEGSRGENQVGSWRGRTDVSPPPLIRITSLPLRTVNCWCESKRQKVNWCQTPGWPLCATEATATTSASAYRPAQRVFVSARIVVVAALAPTGPRRLLLRDILRYEPRNIFFLNWQERFLEVAPQIIELYYIQSSFKAPSS